MMAERNAELEMGVTHLKDIQASLRHHLIHKVIMDLA
jgi:hypothetical protein